ncbi:hypothetical protein K2X40_01035 [Candidatus Babeliales bacterium]|nr:hypothetical protein [Candidatus Babeliales bacterium]
MKNLRNVILGAVLASNMLNFGIYAAASATDEYLQRLEMAEQSQVVRDKIDLIQEIVGEREGFRGFLDQALAIERLNPEDAVRCEKLNELIKDLSGQMKGSGLQRKRMRVSEDSDSEPALRFQRSHSGASSSSSSSGASSSSGGATSEKIRTLKLDRAKRVELQQDLRGNEFICDRTVDREGEPKKLYWDDFLESYSDEETQELHDKYRLYPFKVLRESILELPVSYLGWVSCQKKEEILCPTTQVSSEFIPRTTLDRVVIENKFNDYLSSFFVPITSLEQIVQNRWVNQRAYSLEQAQKARQEAIKARSCVWKVHIQVKPEYIIPFMKDFIKFFSSDDNFKYVYDFKVAEKFVKGSNIPADNRSLRYLLPIMVLYVKEFFSETHEQRNQVLDPIIKALVERYDDEVVGLDITPRGNAKINKLVYIAQDNFDHKRSFMFSDGQDFIDEIYTPGMIFVKGYEYIIPNFKWIN